MRPEASEARNHPIAHDLQHEIIGDERPDDGSVRRDEKEQRRDPSEMGRSDDGVKGGSRFVGALRKQRLCVAGRIKLLGPALGEDQGGRDLRTADKAKN